MIIVILLVITFAVSAALAIKNDENAVLRAENVELRFHLSQAKKETKELRLKFEEAETAHQKLFSELVDKNLAEIDKGLEEIKKETAAINEEQKKLQEETAPTETPKP